NHQGREGADRAFGGREDGREGHGRQAGVGHIEQKGPQPPVLNLLLQQRQRQHADEIGHTRHEQQIPEKTHALASCFSAGSSSARSTGNSQAPSAAAASVLRIMAKPLEMNLNSGTQAIRQLTMTAAATTMRTLFSWRMGGTTMATNML